MTFCGAFKELFNKLNGHFRVQVCLLFKVSPSAKFFLLKFSFIFKVELITITEISHLNSEEADMNSEILQYYNTLSRNSTVMVPCESSIIA